MTLQPKPIYHITFADETAMRIIDTHADSLMFALRRFVRQGDERTEALKHLVELRQLAATSIKSVGAFGSD